MAESLNAPARPAATADRPASARVTKRRRLSPIWIIPAGTLLIAAWLAYQTLSQRGPLITIAFQNAEGLVAGQSQVRFKDIPLGTVQSITLRPDLGGVVVAVRMTREATRLLTDKARFWVVKPRLFAGSLSGFETVLSGSYVAILPSKAPGRPERHYTGLENPPVLQSDIPGTTFLLKASRLGSLTLGSPIFYRDLDVGVVLGWDIGKMAESVTVHAFVRAPFDQYVRRGSRFWNASGASVSLGASGVQLNVESLRALLFGGIAFETPKSALTTKLATANEAFPLYADAAAAASAAFERRVPLVSYFPGSVAGLAVGAPVTLLGIPIGEVTSIDLRYDPKSESIGVPVHFVVQPQRIADIGAASRRGPLANARILVARGMRAELATANLLTGQKEIALSIVPGAPKAEVRLEDGNIIVPTAPGQFADITNAAQALLEKINQMPFTEIGDNLDATLAGLNGLANNGQLRETLSSLKATMAAAQDAIEKLDRGAAPALAELPAITRDLQGLLARTDTLVESANSGYGSNSMFYRDLDRVLLQMNDTMQSLRALSDLLTQQPSALIRGRSGASPSP
ncbi:MAG TPA: MlaD family protein [Acetobacteraceae bacterium]|nr:MlaD family protein [Acetobacteraceae bacterium]